MFIVVLIICESECRHIACIYMYWLYCVYILVMLLRYAVKKISEKLLTFFLENGISKLLYGTATTKFK